MVTIGTPLNKSSTKIILCGSGELGKELALEFQNYGIEIIAIDRYDNAPAMQVSHKKYVIDMLDKDELKKIVYKESPTAIIPEIEAINIEALLELEEEGYTIIPNGKTIMYTMNRENIRNLASKKLKLNTSQYIIVSSLKEAFQKIHLIRYPCIMKPIMSSSGRGQSIIRNSEDVFHSWEYAIHNARGNFKKVIIEEFIDFDYEITLLTVKTKNKILFCSPIGH